MSFIFNPDFLSTSRQFEKKNAAADTLPFVSYSCIFCFDLGVNFRIWFLQEKEIVLETLADTFAIICCDSALKQYGGKVKGNMKHEDFISLL